MELRRILIGAAVFVFAVSVLFFALEFKQFLDFKRERAEVEERIERLAARRDRLNELSNSARTGGPDEKHAEQLIRERLGLIKRGEKIFIFRR